MTIEARAEPTTAHISPAVPAERLPAATPERFSLLDYYALSVGLGLKSVLSGSHRRASLGRILNPLSFPRPAEFREALHNLAPALDEGRVLDIGSPKLPMLALARRRPNLEIYATDIMTSFIEPTRFFLQRAGLGDRVGDTLHLRAEDARRLSFEDGFFDWVYTVSVLEHIADDFGPGAHGAGDGAAMREIARVLRPNGTVTLTVPFDAAGHREEFLKGRVYERAGARDEDVFYQRFYDEQSLEERIIRPSGLQCVARVLLGEAGRLKVEPGWNRIPMKLKAPLLPLQGIAGCALFRPMPESQKHNASGIALKLVKRPGEAS